MLSLYCPYYCSALFNNLPLFRRRLCNLYHDNDRTQAPQIKSLNKHRNPYLHNTIATALSFHKQLIHCSVQCHPRFFHLSALEMHAQSSVSGRSHLNGRLLRNRLLTVRTKESIQSILSMALNRMGLYKGSSHLLHSADEYTAFDVDLLLFQIEALLRMCAFDVLPLHISIWNQYCTKSLFFGIFQSV